MLDERLKESILLVFLGTNAFWHVLDSVLQVGHVSLFPQTSTICFPSSYAPCMHCFFVYQWKSSLFFKT